MSYHVANDCYPCSCGCSSNNVVGKGRWGGGVVGNRTGARAKLRFDLTIDLEKKAPDWSDAKSSSSTTIYGKACEFDAVADLEELQIGQINRTDTSRSTRFWSLQIQSGAATERALNVTEWVQTTIIYNEVDIIKLRT